MTLNKPFITFLIDDVRVEWIAWNIPFFVKGWSGHCITCIALRVWYVNEVVLILIVFFSPSTESRSNSFTPIVSQKELQRLTYLKNRSSSPLTRFEKKLQDQPQPPPADAVHAMRYRFTRYATAGGSCTAPSSPETRKEDDTTPAATATAAETGSRSSPSQSSASSIATTTTCTTVTTSTTTITTSTCTATCTGNGTTTMVKSNPVLVHVADYVSSDCVDSSDDQQSFGRASSVQPATADSDDREPFPESSDEELPSAPRTEETPSETAAELPVQLPMTELSAEELPVTTVTATAQASAPSSSSPSSAVVQVTGSKSDGQIYREKRARLYRYCDDGYDDDGNERLDVSTSSLNRQTQCCMSFKVHNTAAAGSKSSARKHRSQSHSCCLV